MKRILLSILIAFVLVTVYMVAVSIIFLLNNEDVSIVLYINLPVRLPQIIYYYFYPPTTEDYRLQFSQRKVFLGLSFFAANVLLYSILVYFIWNFLSRFRKPKLLQTETPPPPPTFE